MIIIAAKIKFPRRCRILVADVRGAELKTCDGSTAREFVYACFSKKNFKNSFKWSKKEKKN